MSIDLQHLEQIEQFAQEALDVHGLSEAGWTYAWDRARRRFGCCDYSKKQITLSVHLAAINSFQQCQDTILHEIAHALAGREAGHGPKWKEACLQIGANPQRCYSSDQVNQPPSKYIRYCPHCGHHSPVYRRTKKLYACGRCCKKHNRGKYSSKYLLKTIERKDFKTVSTSELIKGAFGVQIR